MSYRHTYSVFLYHTPIMRPLGVRRQVLLHTKKELVSQFFDFTLFRNIKMISTQVFLFLSLSLVLYCFSPQTLNSVFRICF